MDRQHAQNVAKIALADRQTDRQTDTQTHRQTYLSDIFITVIHLMVVVFIAQGLYSESHGIVSNEFYDPEFGEIFKYGGRNNSDNRWWYGEPVR